MGKLTVLSSGSQGNSYLLECNGEILGIELGIPWNDILKGLNYKTDVVGGFIASHL